MTLPHITKWIKERTRTDFRFNILLWEGLSNLLCKCWPSKYVCLLYYVVSSQLLNSASVVWNQLLNNTDMNESWGYYSVKECLPNMPWVPPSATQHTHTQNNHDLVPIKVFTKKVVTNFDPWIIDCIFF
jgi:hypothetical protein